MRLDGADGRALELVVVGYQFPSSNARSVSYVFDANWLVVDCQATDGTRTWRFHSPCLMTTEARELAAWLDAVAAGRSDLDPTNFTEPVLEFQYVASPPERPVVRVVFRLEARPPWAAEVSNDDWDGIWLEFEMSREGLATAATDLRDELKRYPQR